MALQQHPQPDGWVHLILEHYPLGPHFTPQAAGLLIKVPPAYPFARLDMFWTAPEVRLRDGRLPAGTSFESALDRQWLRFSWHPTAWRQGIDNLATFLAFIDRRLARGD
jgi:hypothetical protein